MSISKRFIDLARAELNSLLDYASRRGQGDGDDGDAGDGGDPDAESDGLAGFSRQELEEELARRRAAHAEVEEAIHGRRGPSTEAPGAAAADRATSSSIERAYATLEVPMGSSFETVRRSYRTLMRKYHPDRHTSSPEKQRAANEVAQRLTEAYKLLQKRLAR